MSGSNQEPQAKPQALLDLSTYKPMTPEGDGLEAMVGARDASVEAEQVSEAVSATEEAEGAAAIPLPTLA